MVSLHRAKISNLKLKLILGYNARPLELQALQKQIWFTVLERTKSIRKKRGYSIQHVLIEPLFCGGDGLLRKIRRSTKQLR